MDHINHASRDRKSPRRFRGFTLIELLVVISIIALLIGILLPALSKARETARDSVCNQNVRQIMTAIVTYATDANEFPRGLLNNAGSPVKREAAHYAPNTNPFQLAIDPSDHNDVGVGLFLLLRQSYATSSEVFVTPALANHKPDRYEITGEARGQITFSKMGAHIDDEANLSYGYSNPYFGHGPSNNGFGPHKFRLGNPELTSNYAVIADRGPSCCMSSDSDIAASSGEGSRSNVHLDGDRERGQHIAYADGHATFSDDHMVGPVRPNGSRDNIFFDQPTLFENVPGNLTDVVIYPMLYADR